MSQRSLPGARRLRLVVPMAARDPEEEFRAATPLELLFDLVFVVAVAQAADRFHHALAAGVVGRSVLSYALVLSMWWLYFDRPEDRLRGSVRTAFLWGYGHLPIFAAEAAVSAAELHRCRSGG